MCLKKVKPSSVDAISSLSDDTLVEILCMLPTKLAASTAILSKRWRHLYPMMTRLLASQHRFILDDAELFYPGEGYNIERKHIHKKSFRDFVEKTLSSSNSIKKVSIKSTVHPRCLAYADQWIPNVLQQGVVELDLRFNTSLLSDTNRRPSSFLRSKTLVKLTLELESGDRRIFYRRGSLPVLKSLCLHGIWSRCEAFCHNMLSCCPILEELSLQYYPCSDNWAKKNPGRFSLSHNTLKRLTVHYNSSLEISRLARFKTPSLVYLDYSGLVPLRDSTVKLLDSLVEAKLDIGMPHRVTVHTDILPIINWMCNVETLSLSSTSVKGMYASSCFKRLPLFLNLVKLSFESNTKNGWKVLPRLLKKSPKLETLILKGLHYIKNQGFDFSVHRNKVKVLEIYGFRGSCGGLSQVECFLRKMSFLQVMKVEIDDDDKKLEVMNDLLALRKRSSKLQIQFL